MLTKRIIPCLDVTGGRVVKGINFVGLRDAGDPVELSDRYNRDGADELVFLDITASSDHRDTMADVVDRTSRKVFIPLTVGGGIRSVKDARKILMVGADKVSVNTAAVERPELLRELAEEFRDYARRGGQVLVSTHSPEFLNGAKLDEIYWLVKKDGFATVRRASESKLLRDLYAEGDLPGALWKQRLFEGADPE